MKKTLAVVISAVMILMCLVPAAFASDSYKNAYSVTVVEKSADKINIFQITDSFKEGGLAAPVKDTVNGNNVIEGAEFNFLIECKGSFQFDGTVVVKAFPSTYYLDMIKSVDETDESEGLVLEPYAYKYKDNPADEKEEVKTADIYTIPAVNEDMVIVVYNMTKKGTASVKDFLLNMFNFFLNWIKWFFLGEKI